MHRIRTRPSSPAGVAAAAAAAAAALALLLAARPASCQVVRGMVVEAGGGTPVQGAMVVLMGYDGQVVGRVLTDERGAFIARADHPGPHTIRVDRIGYESLTTSSFDVPVEGIVRRVEMPIRPVELVGLDVEGSRRCTLRAEQGRATARVWEEARKALQAAAWTLTSGLYHYTLLQFERDLDPDGRRVRRSSRTPSSTRTACTSKACATGWWRSPSSPSAGGTCPRSAARSGSKPPRPGSAA